MNRFRKYPLAIISSTECPYSPHWKNITWKRKLCNNYKMLYNRHLQVHTRFDNMAINDFNRLLKRYQNQLGRLRGIGGTFYYSTYSKTEMNLMGYFFFIFYFIIFFLFWLNSLAVRKLIQLLQERQEKNGDAKEENNSTWSSIW